MLYEKKKFTGEFIYSSKLVNLSWLFLNSYRSCYYLLFNDEKN